MKLVKWLVLGLVVVVGLAFAGWWFLLRSDPAPRAQIELTPTTTPTTVAGQSGTALDGTWTVSPGDSRNFVGYRVTEKLVANISESTATGRTSDVNATMKIDGTTVSDVNVTADLTGLQSDNSFRDGRIRSTGLESDRFPNAGFVLTTPIVLGAQPAIGETIEVQATGNFTLHGVTIPADAKVLLLTGAANRDPSVFPDPDRFDLDRDTGASLAFGNGRHHCLGANLGRLEARIALQEVTAVVADYEIDESGAERVHSSNDRGFVSLPTRITARR